MNLDLLPNKKKGLVKKLTNLHRVLQFKQLNGHQTYSSHRAIENTHRPHNHQ